MSIDDITEGRSNTHGDFTDQARIAQDLKNIVEIELEKRGNRGQEELDDTAKEAISMILHKISRIIAGKWDEEDHWVDIQGYAKITEERLTKTTGYRSQEDQQEVWRALTKFGEKDLVDRFTNSAMTDREEIYTLPENDIDFGKLSSRQVAQAAAKQNRLAKECKKDCIYCSVEGHPI